MSERSQSRDVIYCMIPFTQHSGKGNNMGTSTDQWLSGMGGRTGLHEDSRRGVWGS